MFDHQKQEQIWKTLQDALGRHQQGPFLWGITKESVLHAEGQEQEGKCAGSAGMGEVKCVVWSICVKNHRFHRKSFRVSGDVK